MDIDIETLRALAVCADRAAIENVLGLYCRAIDRLDLELLKSVYHADAIDDHGAMCLNGHEFAERIIATIRDLCVYSMHTVTHSVIDVEGDTAAAESYYLGYHTIAADAATVEKFFGRRYLEEQGRAGLLDQRHEYICGGRYIDVLHKRAGVWRIFRRKMTNEWSVSRPENLVTEGVPAAFVSPGRRDRQDPVYRLQAS
jgi:SnoaL-like domain